MPEHVSLGQALSRTSNQRARDPALMHHLMVKAPPLLSLVKCHGMGGDGTCTGPCEDLNSDLSSAQTSMISGMLLHFFLCVCVFVSSSVELGMKISILPTFQVVDQQL